MTSNFCIKSSVIDAFHLGYNIIVPSDCVTASKIENHNQAIKDIKEFAKVTSSENLTY